jgi:serine/threonine protein kinase
VYRCEYKCPKTGAESLFAIKKLKMVFSEYQDQGFPLTALREIKYLQSLDHENIVKIR